MGLPFVFYAFCLSNYLLFILFAKPCVLFLISDKTGNLLGERVEGSVGVSFV